MRGLAQKQQDPQAQKATGASHRRADASLHNHSVLQLQRILGNEAVLRLIRARGDALAQRSNPAASRVADDHGRISVFGKAPVAIQKTSLTVNAPGDSYEQEAERVADQVMRMPSPQVQRTCECGGQCPECQKDQQDEERDYVQAARVSAGGGEDVAAPPIVHDVLRSPGRPLDLAARDFMEPRFGHDFSQVRVHTDTKAGESARAIDALAYTVGRDVVFAESQYAPETTAGRRLLAHELTHVMQQRSDVSSGVLHRQPPPPKPTTAATTDCVQPGADQHMQVEAGAVTVIAYGNTSWCEQCRVLKKDMEDLCKSLTKPAVPVRFYDVEIDDITAPPPKTWPPFSGSGFPQLLIYSGQFQLFHETAITAADLKTKVEKAISCANKPWTCGPIVPSNCSTITATTSTPTGTRFIFNEGTVDFAPGEESALVRFAKGVKAAGPNSTVNILGMAMGGGDDAWKKTLSCHRALLADSIFRAEGLTVGPLQATGGVPGTETNHGFRAVDIEVKPGAGAAPQAPGQTQGDPGQQPGQGLQTLPGTNTCTTPPNCVFDAVIKGPTLIEDKAKDPKATGMARKQTASCTHYLFQISPTSQTTSNTQMLHVQWKKDPPANTLSITRTAQDDDGDAPAGKAPSFAALNPGKPANPAKNAFAIDTLPNCKTTSSLPSWCVPFCSFGDFVMDASVIWQCDPTNCKRNNIFKVPTFIITVKEKP